MTQQIGDSLLDELERLTEFVDIYPTLCEIAGIPCPSNLEGTSLLPRMMDPQRAWQTAALSQYPRRISDAATGNQILLMGYTMRTERYRYTEWLNREGVKTEPGQWFRVLPGVKPFARE